MLSYNNFNFLTFSDQPKTNHIYCVDFNWSLYSKALKIITGWDWRLTYLNPIIQSTRYGVCLFMHVNRMFCIISLILNLFQWPYSEFVSIVPNVKAPGNNEFIITMRKGPKKTDSMKFSTDHRSDLLTEALVCLTLSVCDK